MYIINIILLFTPAISQRYCWPPDNSEVTNNTKYTLQCGAFNHTLLCISGLFYKNSIVVDINALCHTDCIPPWGKFITFSKHCNSYLYDIKKCTLTCPDNNIIAEYDCEKRTNGMSFLKKSSDFHYDKELSAVICPFEYCYTSHPTPPKNGQLEALSNKTSYKYQCDEGYHAKNSNNRTGIVHCNKTSWETPLCVVEECRYYSGGEDCDSFCGYLPPISTNVNPITLACKSKYFCIFRCNEGYIPLSHQEEGVICSRFGWDIPKCTLKTSCRNVLFIDNQVITTEECRKDEINNNTNCNYECPSTAELYFNKDHIKSFKVDCKNGLWENDYYNFMASSRIDCYYDECLVNPINHTILHNVKFDYLAINKTYICDEGYRAENSFTRKGSVECTENGWSLPKCNLFKCDGRLPSIENGHYVDDKCQEGNNTTNTTCAYECNDGFSTANKMVNENNTPLIICQSDLSWSVPPFCEIDAASYSCYKPPRILSDEVYNIEYCDYHSKITQIFCKFYCKRGLTYLKPFPRRDKRVNNEIEVEAEKGKFGYIFCRNQSWDTPLCTEGCFNEPDLNDHVKSFDENCVTNNNFLKLCKFRCETGYEPVEKQKNGVICTLSGWEKAECVQKKKMCVNRIDIKRVKTSEDCSNSYVESGTFCTFECHQKNYFQKSKITKFSSTCLNGLWDETNYKEINENKSVCVNKECYDKFPENSQNVKNLTIEKNFDLESVYFCVKGYFAINSNNSRGVAMCNIETGWEKPLCIKNERKGCTIVPSIKNAGYLNPSKCRKGYFTEETECEYECFAGYSSKKTWINDKNVSIISCTNNKTWDHIPNCKEDFCSIDPIFTNLTGTQKFRLYECKYDNSGRNELCYFECTKGRVNPSQLTRNSMTIGEIYCHDNQWQFPSCLPKIINVCRHLPQISENVDYFVSSCKQNTETKQFCKFFCEDGYKPAESQRKGVECKSSGWEKPICVLEKFCLNPFMNDNSLIIQDKRCTNNKIRENMTCEFECPENTYFKNSRKTKLISICLNGLWDETNYKEINENKSVCVNKECYDKFPEKSENVKNITIENNFDLESVYFCVKGYFAINSNNSRGVAMCNIETGWEKPLCIKNEIKKCPIVPFIENAGYLNPSKCRKGYFTEETECEYKCLVGYSSKKTWINDKNVSIISCTNNKTWDHIPNCEEDLCSSIDPIFTNLTGTQKFRLYECKYDRSGRNKLCYFQCAEGRVNPIQSTQNSTKIGEIYCQNNQWQFPSCLPICKESPPKQPHVKSFDKNCLNNLTRFILCSFQCEEGYLPIPSQTEGILCTFEGWSVPVCRKSSTALKDCKNNPIGPRVITTRECTYETITHNTTCNFICPAGTYFGNLLVNSLSSSCNNGLWKFNFHHDFSNDKFLYCSENIDFQRNCSKLWMDSFDKKCGFVNRIEKCAVYCRLNKCKIYVDCVDGDWRLKERKQKKKLSFKRGKEMVSRVPCGHSMDLSPEIVPKYCEGIGSVIFKIVSKNCRVDKIVSHNEKCEIKCLGGGKFVKSGGLEFMKKDWITIRCINGRWVYGHSSALPVCGRNESVVERNITGRKHNNDLLNFEEVWGFNVFDIVLTMSLVL